MASAAAAKKCARPSHLIAASPTKRMYASCTSAVGCSVSPGFSLLILWMAKRRNSA